MMWSLICLPFAIVLSSRSHFLHWENGRHKQLESHHSSIVFLVNWPRSGELPTDLLTSTQLQLTNSTFVPLSNSSHLLQSNFFAALDDSDNEGKTPAPAVAKKKEKAPPPLKKEVVEPSKVENRP